MISDALKSVPTRVASIFVEYQNFTHSVNHIENQKIRLYLLVYIGRNFGPACFDNATFLHSQKLK